MVSLEAGFEGSTALRARVLPRLDGTFEVQTIEPIPGRFLYFFGERFLRPLKFRSFEVTKVCTKQQ